MTPRPAHILEAKWNLTHEEILNWIRDLRKIRIGVRDKIQPYVDRPFASDLAEMRVKVCEYITNELRPLLLAYWRASYRTNGSGPCDFFFSPGYRPFGRDRAPLETPSSHMNADAQQHPLAQFRHELELRLGRHSEHATESNKPLFTLALWMAKVYSEEIKSCKIGGFTDWFDKFEKVALADGSPLVCLVLTISTQPDAQTQNGVSRYNLGEETAPSAFLTRFKVQLLQQLVGLRILRKRKDAHPEELFLQKMEDIHDHGIIPYPPAHVRRNTEWFEVDLSKEPPRFVDRFAGELLEQELQELQIAKERFACLFHSIFHELFTLPDRLTADAVTSEITTTLQWAADLGYKLQHYSYYHVFVTDQDLSIEKHATATHQSIGSKIGTLNLYTDLPICDTGLGLIRDSLEAIYDSVRDAEIITAFARIPLHSDPYVAKWLLRYCEAWHSDSISDYIRYQGSYSNTQWHHDHFDHEQTYYPYAICADNLKTWSSIEPGAKPVIAKNLVQTEFDASRQAVKQTGDSERYFLQADLPMLQEIISYNNLRFQFAPGCTKWAPPFLPSFCFFLALRILVTFTGNTRPASIVLVGSAEKSAVQIELANDGKRDKTLEQRWTEKLEAWNAKQEPIDGFCRRLYWVWHGVVETSEAGKTYICDHEWSEVPIDLLAKEFTGSRILVTGQTVRVEWDNPAGLDN